MTEYLTAGFFGVLIGLILGYFLIPEKSSDYWEDRIMGHRLHDTTQRLALENERLTARIADLEKSRS